MKLSLLLVAMSLPGFCMAADTLTVTLNKQKFQPGDTIIFTASFEPWVQTKKNATLNVIMEDVHR